MIIIKVQGGLGNQLLQYSIGQVIQARFHKDVAYDITFFNQDTKYTKRPYHLDAFRMNVRVATKEEIEQVRYPYGMFSKVISLFVRALNKYVIQRYYIGYEKSFFPLVAKKESLYLEGFWQSYKYYEENLHFLNSLVVLNDMSNVETFKKEVCFEEKVSVSLHIRRGDLLNKGAGTQTVQQEYYERAIPFFERSVRDARYFIFSDDIEWVRTALGHLFKDAVYVSSKNLSDREEFMLMKDCNHAILSNSTFCFLPTLLTDNDEKVVCYPNDWKNTFLNKQKNALTDENSKFRKMMNELIENNPLFEG